jgi:polar amino acid transport system permease protein
MDYQISYGTLLPYIPLLIDGLTHTVFLAMTSILIGLVFGLLGGCSLSYGPAWVRGPTRAYVEFFRNTPALVQLFLIYYGLPNIGIQLSPTTAGIVTMSLYFGSYAVEIFRAGLESISRTQIEAGQSLGISAWQVFRHVILVPASRAIYPSLSSQMVLAFIGTSLVSQIGVEEVFHAASFIDSRTFRSFEVYSLICIVYFVSVMVFKGLLKLIEYYAFQRGGWR